MTSKKAPLFDFGNFSADDVTRVINELQSHEQMTVNEEAMKVSSRCASEFIAFVRMVLEGLELLRLTYAELPIVEVSATEGASEEELLRRGWNKVAHKWAVIESPGSYFLTMQTLIQFLRLDDKRRQQNILSLGSGPGLYETYLGHIFEESFPGLEIRLRCIDSANEMTECHQRILRHARWDGRKVRCVQPATDDMTHLHVPDDCVDQIICNNSLQWTPDWRKAIAEMARVMRPDGVRQLYLFVHTHPMVLRDVDWNPVVERGKFTIHELMDALEEQHFDIHQLRQLAGCEGTGQMGGGLSRVFFLARWEPKEKIVSWRDKRVSAALSGIKLGR